MRRYFFTEPITEIAGRYQMSTNNVMVNLSRTRKKLKAYLEKEGLLGEKPQGSLEIYTTGSVEEYTQRAAQVGLERVRGVYSYPALG